MNCPNCGKEVKSDEAVFCPYCAKPLRATKRSAFLTSSGILTIISSSLLLAIGMLFILIFASSSYNYYYGYYSAFLIVGILNILGFAFGLTGSILTLKRRIFPLAIIEIVLVLGSSIITSILSGGFFIFGIPVFIMSLLSLIFTAISKSKFE